MIAELLSISVELRFCSSAIQICPPGALRFILGTSNLFREASKLFRGASKCICRVLISLRGAPNFLRGALKFLCGAQLCSHGDLRRLIGTAKLFRAKLHGEHHGQNL